MKILKSQLTISILLMVLICMFSCTNSQNAEKNKSVQVSTEVSSEINSMLDEQLNITLKDETSFQPECNKEYPIHIYNRVLVNDCNDIQKDEIRRMATGLFNKAKDGASKICELNPDCPNARLVSYTIDKNVCKNRLWEVDVTFIFVCEL